MTQPSVAPAIELVDVTKRYGDAVALDGLSLRIDSGEFFCLLGPSGCGKTTTLNLIGGFIPLTSGELRIEGRRGQRPARRIERNVNTVFQNYALFPHMTVAENVAFGLRMEGLDGQEIASRVDEYLELVGPGGRTTTATRPSCRAVRRSGSRSRAPRQAPSRAPPRRAAGRPRPEAPQADAGRAGAIHRQVGTTFVFVTHDQEEALSMATRIAVMSGGRCARSARRARSTSDRSTGSSPTSSASRTSSTGY